MVANAENGRPLTVPVTVEFEDVDAYGIAHHARLVAYLERARVRLLGELGMDLSRADLHLVLYDLAVRFKRTVALGERLEVTVAVRSIDAVRFVLGYAVRRGGQLVARATTALAFVDGATKAIVPIPEEHRRALAARGGLEP
jgi:acyl-CoA thioester hydrolase